MESQGYEESVTVSNIKLIAGTIAVIVAVFSHFGAGEFPQSRPTVLACVVTYIACTALISITSVLLEASAMFVGRLAPRARRVSKGVIPERVWVHTSIGGKGSSTFRVQVRTSARGKSDASEDSHGYERYFTTEGHFLKDKFTSDMRLTLDRATQGGKKKKQ